MGTNKCASQSGMTAYGTRRHLYDPKNHILPPMDHSTISLQMGTNKCASQVGCPGPPGPHLPACSYPCPHACLSLRVPLWRSLRPLCQLAVCPGEVTSRPCASPAPPPPGLPRGSVQPWYLRICRFSLSCHLACASTMVLEVLGPWDASSLTWGAPWPAGRARPIQLAQRAREGVQAGLGGTHGSLRYVQTQTRPRRSWCGGVRGGCGLVGPPPPPSSCLSSCAGGHDGPRDPAAHLRHQAGDRQV